MTPLSIRPTLPRAAVRSARRTKLLAASALCGVAAMLAQPALAQLPGVPSAANITVSTGGSQPIVTAPDANTLEIDLNASRTVINWPSLNVGAADAMNFHFDANSDIVLNKTTSQITIASGGTVSGKVGAATGGNIWFYSPQGVIVSPGAVMTAGGFLFSRGGGIVDAGFVDAGDPLAVLRAAADSLIRIDTITSATSASISAGGDVVLSASTGNINAAIVAGADTATVTATTGTLSVTELRASGGAAAATAGGAGATVTTLVGATGATVTSNGNTSVGSATTTTSGDITIQGGTVASLSLANSARDVTLSAPQVFVSTIDAARDVFITGTTGGATVTNRVFAGDDVEVTATTGAVSAGGATLRSTGVGASDDAHVLARSTGAGVTVGTALTEGTGAAAGDVTLSAATTATLTTGDSSRDLRVGGVTASLDSGDAVRDVFVTATTGGANVTTQITAGDDIEVTATSGGVSTANAVLTSTGVGATDDAHVLLRSTGNWVDFGGAITQGVGVAAGNVTIEAGDTITGESAASTRDVWVTAPWGIALESATAARDITLFATVGDVTLGRAELTGSGAGHDLLVTADGVLTFGGADAASIGTANTFSRTGGNTGTAVVRSLTADARVYLDASATIDTLDGVNIDVTVNTGPVTFGALTAQGDLAVWALGGALNVGGAIAYNGDLEFNAYGGAMTVGAIDAPNGNLALYAYDDALTVTGSVHGGGQTQLQSFGLLDGTAASLISSDGALQLYGGQIDVGSVQADDVILVGADDGNIDVQSAVSSVGVSIAALDGDVFVDVVEGDTGVGVLAAGDVLINSVKANSAGGLVFVEAGGDAMVNLAEAKGAGGTVEVGAFGNATLRAAEATDGILVYAIDTGRATFGADNGAPITSAYYGVTAAASGCGCSPAPDGLQVFSEFGDAVVNAYSVSNPIALVASGEFNNVMVTLQTGDLKIDELAGYNITIDAKAGTLETVSANSGGGDYTITAHDFLGDALTPTLFTGLIRDVTITDTLGGLDLGTTAIHADRKLTITALNGGAVTGLVQLDAGAGAGDGWVDVTANGVALDTVVSDGDLDLDGGTGLVNVATSVIVDGTYRLTGGDFSGATLAPVGAKAGSWTIIDQVGDFDFTGKTLHYGSSIAVNVFNGNVIGGDITSDAGLVFVEADGGGLGALYAGGGQVTAIGNVGGMAVDSAQGVTRATITAVNGTASLGSAILTGPGIHGLTVRATNGDVVLGAASSGAITTGNFVTSTGSSIALVAQALAGKVDVNLDHTTNANMTTLDGRDGVTVRVVNGSQRIITARSTGGSVWITGPTGALTVDQLTAADVSQVRAGGETRLVSANVTAGGLSVVSNSAGVRLGDATPGRVIAASGTVALTAAADITQQGVIHASGLGGSAGTGVVLLGDNQVDHLGAFSVHGGGLAFHSITDFDVAAPINAIGQTVDLRSDGTINQISLAVITAQKLTGSSVGGAVFAANNQVAELGDFTNTTSRLKLVNGRSLTVSGTVLSTGILSLASHGGMTIAGTGTVRANGAGDAVVLASDGMFTNARGADAVTTGSVAGRWLIYTQALGDPQGPTAGNTFNGLAGKSFYGAAYDFGTSGFAVGPNAGNRFVYAYQPTLTVTPDSKIVTYDGAIPTNSATVAGLVNGDLMTDAWTGALAISGATSKNVGTYSLAAVTGELVSDLNYAFAAGAAGALRIDPKALTGVLAASTKTYDGATTARGAIGLTGVVAGDAVNASGTYAFADRNAGAGKTVTASGAVLTGLDAGNYRLAGVSDAVADILRRSVTVAADSGFKPFGQVEPTLTYRITVGDLAAGDAFTGALTRAAGENPGDYGITRGTLALSTNYDLTFTGAVFTIRPIPANDQGGSSSLKHLNQSPDFTLDWDPEPNLTTEGQIPQGDQSGGDQSGGVQVVALR